MFFTIKTKSNSVFTILITSYIAKNRNYQYIKLVKIILKYMKGLEQQNITYRGYNKLVVKRYSD